MVYVRQDLGFWNHGGTVSEVISGPYSFEHLLNNNSTIERQISSENASALLSIDNWVPHT